MVEHTYTPNRGRGDSRIGLYIDTDLKDQKQNKKFLKNTAEFTRFPHLGYSSLHTFQILDP